MKAESRDQQDAAGVNQRRKSAGERFVQNSNEGGGAQVATKGLDEQSPGYILQRGQQRWACLRNQYNEDGELQSTDEIVRSGKLPVLASFDQPPRCCLLRFFARGIHACITESKSQQPSQRSENRRAQLLIQLGNQQNQEAQPRQRRQHLRWKSQSNELQLRIKMAQQSDGKVDQEQQSHQRKRQMDPRGKDAGTEHYQRFDARPRRDKRAWRTRFQTARQNRQQHAIESHGEEQ